MKIYDEITGAELSAPDQEKGYTYPGQRYVGTERIVLGGTVALYPPGGLEYDKPVYEDCLWYHEYTDGEKPGTDPQPSNVESRLTALEDELQAAKILLGVE